MNFRFRWAGKRSVRRVLVGVYFLSFAGWLTAGPQEFPGGMALAVAVAAGMTLYWITPPAGFRAPGAIDERQRIVRLQAMADAYRVVCVLFAGLLVWSAFSFLHGVGLSLVEAGRSPMMLFFPVMILLSTLPQALLAWREPDIPAAGE